MLTATERLVLPVFPLDGTARHQARPAPDHTERRDRADQPCQAGDEVTVMLTAVAAGDRSAFAPLYAATSTQVHRLAQRVLRCPEQAADVSQEVYLQVWQQAARFDPDRGGALSWILTLTHRRAVDRVRRLIRMTSTDDRWADQASDARDEVCDTAIARADAQAVRRAVTRLSPVQCEAITLAYLHGKSGPEIAALLQVPLGTVKTRLRDGLAALRRAQLAAGEISPLAAG